MSTCASASPPCRSGAPRLAAASSNSSRRLSRLPHPNRHDDDLDAAELQPALDRKRGLVMERASEEALALEHQLPGEDHRAPELLHEIETHVLELLDQVGADRVAVLGIDPHTLREVHELLEVSADARLELGHRFGPLE